jgi:DMSO reductase family type II enzyme molybdopterin subunit
MSERSADEKTRGNAGSGPADEAHGTQDATRGCPLTQLTRREFVVAGCSTAAGLSLGSPLGCNQQQRDSQATPRRMEAPAAPGGEAPSSPTDFANRYRSKWSWEGSVRNTHNVNCWFQQNCCWNVYTRDGVVIREEQAAVYPQSRPDVPDFNPRGCQKGCSYSELMYSAPRVTRPLRRDGPRGSGEWREVSWDEALEDIAGRMVDAIVNHGSDTIVHDAGTNIVSQLAFASLVRFADATDGIILDMNAEIGDDQQGAAVTYGDIAGDRSGDDYFFADTIFIWGGNPVYTQIPNFHFLSEARYHGTQIVAICPDLNASAIHADLWVGIQPGTDAALALSMARVILDEGLYDAETIREQTDLPFLVRLEDGKFLRESDLVRGGSDEVLYRYDLGRQAIEKASTASLELDESLPALEGTFTVETLDGPAFVQPIFERLKAKLADYAPEEATTLCGVSPAMIRKLARMMAGSKAAANVCTSSISKFYHGDAMMRAQILVFILCGHLGRKGAGYASCSVLLADGHGAVYRDSQIFKELRWPLLKKHGLRLAKDFITGADMHRALDPLLTDAFLESGLFVNSTLFWNLHGGVFDVSGRPWDPELKRPVREYLDEALAKDWQRLEPAAEKTPRVLFSIAGNLLRRVRSAHRIQEELWPKLDLIVALELRMSSTALYADYVLPVASAYEKSGTMAFNTNPQMPYLHTTNAAVEPVGDSKDEWEILCLLAKKIQEIAKERGLRSFTGRNGGTRRLDRVYDAMTRGGEISEGESEKLSQILVDASSNLSDTSWEELREQGFARFSGLGRNPLNFGQASDIPPDDTITPYTWHTRDKKPWPTLTGRVQFYIDHDWYLELGEELPTHKTPPKAGGDHPLVMTGGHTRWSIHATWQTDPLMLRLQRGEPCMWISVRDAADRGIEDGDRIEVGNDVGRFVTRAKVSAAVRPGQVIMYHAWENYQFEGGMGYRNVQASPINPLELVGNYPYLGPSLAIRQPGGNDRDTRVEIRGLPGLAG